MQFEEHRVYRQVCWFQLGKALKLALYANSTSLFLFSHGTMLFSPHSSRCTGSACLPSWRAGLTECWLRALLSPCKRCTIMVCSRSVSHTLIIDMMINENTIIPINFEPPIFNINSNSSELVGGSIPPLSITLFLSSGHLDSSNKQLANDCNTKFHHDAAAHTFSQRSATLFHYL